MAPGGCVVQQGRYCDARQNRAHSGNGHLGEMSHNKAWRAIAQPAYAFFDLVLSPIVADPQCASAPSHRVRI